MLRRVKGDVENELAPKTEIDLYCELSARQRRFYQVKATQTQTQTLHSNQKYLPFFLKFVRRNVSIAEIGLLKSSMEKGRGRPSEVQMKRLMNLVMQFRKVFFFLSFSFFLSFPFLLSFLLFSSLLIFSPKVCNHPDIFERNDVTSPFSFSPLKVDAGTTFSSPLSLSLPRLIYQEGLAYGGRERSLKGCRGSLRSSLTGLETPLSTFLVDRCLRLKLNIFCPDYIAGRVLEGGEITSPSSFQSASSFSFLRFSGTSIGEVDEMINSPYLAWFRWLSARVRTIYLLLFFFLKLCSSSRINDNERALSMGPQTKKEPTFWKLNQKIRFFSWLNKRWELFSSFLVILIAVFLFFFFFFFLFSFFFLFFLPHLSLQKKNQRDPPSSNPEKQNTKTTSPTSNSTAVCMSPKRLPPPFPSSLPSLEPCHNNDLLLEGLFVELLCLGFVLFLSFPPMKKYVILL